MQHDLFLAIDHGGSKCDCAILRGDGTLRSWGHFFDPGQSGRSAYAINAAVTQALCSGNITEEDSVTLCFIQGYSVRLQEGSARSGLGTQPDASHRAHPIVKDFFANCVDDVAGFRAKVDYFAAVDEHGAALAMCGFEDGIVALAGTGAFIDITLTERKVWLHVDGMGPVAGDHGSAYQIGLAAFRAAVVAADRRIARRTTTLRDAVFHELKLGDTQDATRFSLQGHDRSVMASLAKVVDREARQGDGIARRILEDAADDLCATLQDALEMTQLTNEALPLVGTGSMLVKSPIYWNRFCERAHSVAPRLDIHRNQRPSVLGIALCGMIRKGKLSREEGRRLLADINAGYDDFVKKQTQREKDDNVQG